MFLEFLLAIALVAPQMPSRDASISSALAQLNNGRIFESIDEFKEIVRLDPANGPAYF